MRGWWRDTAGGLPPTYWYLWAGLLINRMGGFAVLFLSLYLTAQRGTSAAVAGLVVGTYGIGGVIGTLAGGVLTDRWGRRRTLVWSHLGCAITLAALALTPELKMIAVLCALLGLVQSMPAPAFVAAIIDLVPAERRSRAFNLQFWAFNLGTAGASLLAGLLAEWSYVALFLIDGVSSLVAAAVIASKVPETLPRPSPAPAPGAPPAPPTRATPTAPSQANPTAAPPSQANPISAPSQANPTPAPPSQANPISAPSQANPTPAPPSQANPISAPSRANPTPTSPPRLNPMPAASIPARPPGGLLTVLADRIFLAFAGLTLLEALIYTQTSTIVPLAMREDGLSAAAYGVVVALSGALIVVGQLFVPRVIDGHRKDRVLAASQVATAIGFAVLIFADRLPAYLVAAVVWTVGSMLAAPPNAEINSELAPPALRGRYQAVFYLTFPAASFLAPSLGGAGLQFLGSLHWLVIAGIALAAAGLHLAAGPRRERHVATIRHETTATAALSESH